MHGGNGLITLQAFVDGLTLGGIYAMVAIGFAVIFTTTRMFHFAHGGIYVFVAFTIAAIAQSSTSLWLVAIPVGIVVAVTLGLASETLVYRPMRRRIGRSLIGEYGIFVGSLGMLVILDNAVPLVFGYNPYPLMLYGVTPSVHFGQIYVQTAGILQFATALVMLGAVMAIMRWTQFGRSMRALADNVEMTAIVGVETRRVYLGAFALGSLLLVPAALLNSVTTGLDSSIGDTMILVALVAVIVGGVDSVPGAALGGFLIGIVQSMSLLILPSMWEQTSAYVLLVVVLLVRPTGILGRRRLTVGI